MEEETYTRWLFPGAFAAGTFLWLAYISDPSMINNLFSSETRIKVLVVLLTGVPVIGFIAGSLVRLFTNDYTGRCCWRSKVRNICKDKFKDVSLQSLVPLEVCSIDPDVLFSLAALGVIKGHSMPELLIKHGRRRWTTWWTALNSIMGILLGIFVYFILLFFLFILRLPQGLINDPVNALLSIPKLISFVITMIILFAVSCLLFYIGYRAWCKEEDLEMGWFVLTYGPNGERLSNLIQEQLKGDFVKMSRVTIKYNNLIELLKTLKADTVIEEALKVGEIDIVDDVSGEKIGVISLKKDSNKNL